MFYTVLGIYIIGVILCILAIYWIIGMESNDGKQWMLAYMMCAVVQNVGYIFELTAHSPDAALTAIRMQYLGSTYVMLFLCEYVYYFLRSKPPKYLYKIWSVVNTCILLTMWLDDYFHLFYKDKLWVEDPVHSYMQITYNFGFYFWLLFCCVLPCFIVMGMLLHSFRERKSRHVRKQSAILMGIAAVPLVVLIIYVFIDRSEYDFNPMVLGLTLSSLTLFLFKTSTYENSRLSVGRMSDHLSEAVIIVNDLGKVVDKNEQATKFFNALEGMPFETFFEEIRQRNRDSESPAYEVAGKTFESKFEEIRAKDGTLIGYLIMLFDTTALHQAMKELKRARDAAEEANRAKSQFLSNVSHEIRTPMNSIIGITDILMRGKHDKDEQGYLNNIKSSGEALVTIINEILDFSKIENGDMQLQEEEYGFLSILQDLGMLFLNRIGDKPIELLFDIDSDLPARMVGDRVRVRQVIINIVSNAIKYTSGGYIKLVVRCEPTEDHRYLLSFQVADTGVGIKPEDVKKLFHEFIRVDMKNNYEKEGTGLGLVISKRLIEQMGGSIGVESIYGMGTRFSFNLYQKAADTMEPAIDLSAHRGETISCRFTNNSLLSTLVPLVNSFQMKFVMKPELQPHLDYFITDIHSYYQMHSSIETMKQNGTKVIVLQNPMETNPKIPGDMVVNKPLYSLSFANAINGVQMEDENDLVHKNSFIAPGARILVVDDNNMNLKVARGLLDVLQVNVETAFNGREALERIKQGSRYDIILMDHMMPVMDGVEAVKAIRAMEDEYCKSVPIIALTANAIVGVREMFIESGMNDMISKPISVKLLYRMMREYLPKDLVIELDGDKPKKPKDEAVQKTPVYDEKEAEKRTDEIPGLDRKKGMMFCRNEETLYEMYADFCRDITEKSNLIRQYVKNEAYKQYTTEVHGLKGVSRMIGATELGEHFYALEQLGKEENLDGIRENTEPVLEEYRLLGEAINAHFKSNSSLAH